MGATSNVPPGSNPFKARYMMSDLARLQLQFNVPVRPEIPDNFPMNTLQAQRVLTVVKKQYPEKLVPLSKCIWNRGWGHGKDIGKSEELIYCLGQLFTEDQIKELTTQARGSAAKEELQRVTNEAVEAYGSFGAPWM